MDPSLNKTPSETSNPIYEQWAEIDVTENPTSDDTDIARTEDSPKTNVDKLQTVLNRAGFDELRQDEAKLKDFFANTDKEKIYKYLAFINQKLREIPRSERGFHGDTMFAGALVSPDTETQMHVLDYEIDALAKIDNPRYRAASAYYTINNLHLFNDGNGRTARTVFKLLDDSNFNLTSDQQLFTHEDNKNPKDTRGGAGELQEAEGIVSTSYFNQLAVLAYLEKKSESDQGNQFFSALKDNLKQKLEYGGGSNIFLIREALFINPGALNISELNDIDGFKSLNEEERKRVTKAFLYRDGDRVTVSALALFEFYREKGLQDAFLDDVSKRSPSEHTWFVDLISGSEDTESQGYQGCTNWTSEDFLHFAELAEKTKEEVLKTGIDVFISPDQYHISDTTIADFAANAKEHPLENPDFEIFRFNAL